MRPDSPKCCDDIAAGCSPFPHRRNYIAAEECSRVLCSLYRTNALCSGSLRDITPKRSQNYEGEEPEPDRWHHEQPWRLKRHLHVFQRACVRKPEAALPWALWRAQYQVRRSTYHPHSDARLAIFQISWRSVPKDTLDHGWSEYIVSVAGSPHAECEIE